MSFQYEPNGNIDTLNWQVVTRPIQQYAVSYDPLNRIKSAHYCEFFDDFTKVSTDNAYGVPSIAYDADGNITRLFRRGITGYCDNGAPQIGLIDDLTYAYEQAPSGISNRLSSVTEAASIEKGFKVSAGTGNYGYDENGNLTSDPYKGLTIEYNALNLPERITKGNESIEFQYDATGRKFSKQSTS